MADDMQDDREEAEIVQSFANAVRWAAGDPDRTQQLLNAAQSVYEEVLRRRRAEIYFRSVAGRLFAVSDDSDKIRYFEHGVFDPVSAARRRQFYLEYILRRLGLISGHPSDRLTSHESELSVEDQLRDLSDWRRPLD